MGWHCTSFQTSAGDHISCVRSRRIPARRTSVVHPRSLISGDNATGSLLLLFARSSQRLSQWHMTNDGEGLRARWKSWSVVSAVARRWSSETTAVRQPIPKIFYAINIPGVGRGGVLCKTHLSQSGGGVCYCTDAGIASISYDINCHRCTETPTCY